MNMGQNKRRWSLVVGRWQKRARGRRLSVVGRQKQRLPPPAPDLFKHKNAPAMLPEHLGIPDG
jgi:hypothetical protein